VTDGVGLTQQWGGPVEKIRAGLGLTAGHLRGVVDVIGTHVGQSKAANAGGVLDEALSSRK
jgi:hypothetical protein